MEQKLISLILLLNFFSLHRKMSKKPYDRTTPLNSPSDKWNNIPRTPPKSIPKDRGKPMGERTPDVQDFPRWFPSHIEKSPRQQDVFSYREVEDPPGDLEPPGTPHLEGEIAGLSLSYGAMDTFSKEFR